MHYVHPKAFHIGTSMARYNGLLDFLTEIGAVEAGFHPMMANYGDTDMPRSLPSDGELLIEVAGRSCYMSFGVSPELNRNVSRVREGTAPYIDNILRQRHGSVLEHAVDTFALTGLSRVCTHELVRHRHGSYSQLSGRYVRVDRLAMTEFRQEFGTDMVREALSALPVEQRRQLKTELGVDTGDLKQDDEVYASILNARIGQILLQIESGVIELSRLLGLDHQTSMPLKKRLTSALRRLMPNGQATVIVVTANQRAWRHMIQMRTSRHAEREIRQVFALVFEQLAAWHPAVYQDAEYDTIDGIKEVTFHYGAA